MTTIARMQRANRGSHFRAMRLHDADPAGLDPFLGVDHAWMSAPTFPPHPHAGFSAVTYLFLDSETGIANRDSNANKTLIAPGGLHWTAAGRGVVHEENPAVPGKVAHLLQIFVNLPQHKQSDAPFALGLSPHDVPVVEAPGVRMRVPLGSFGGQRSPLATPTEVTLLDVSLDAGAVLEVPVAAGERAFFLPVMGTAEVDGEAFGMDDLKVPMPDIATAARTCRLRGLPGGAKVAVFIGAPLGQPVLSNGPMAFASRDGLRSAEAAFQRGEFGSP